MATKKHPKEDDDPIEKAVNEYAEGLKARGDMSEERRDEAVRHYREGLKHFHKGD